MRRNAVELGHAAFGEAPETLDPVHVVLAHGELMSLQWSPCNQATAYWIDVGSSAGGSQYYQSQSLPATTLSATVSNLPTNGGTVYVTLYSLVNGVWLNNQYTYTAYNVGIALGVMQTPTPGSTLSGNVWRSLSQWH